MSGFSRSPRLPPQLPLPLRPVSAVLGPLAGLLERDLVDLLAGQIPGQRGDRGVTEEIHDGQFRKLQHQTAVDLRAEPLIATVEYTRDPCPALERLGLELDIARESGGFSPTR